VAAFRAQRNAAPAAARVEKKGAGVVLIYYIYV
jgi:hypothetical protein